MTTIVLGSGTGGKLMARTAAQDGYESQTTKG